MKKLFGLIAAFFLTLSLGIFAACDDGGETSSSGPADGQIVYTVNLKTTGGLGVKGVTVDVYSGEEKIKTAVSDTNGKVLFYLDPAEYTVDLSNLPLGYHETVSENYLMSEEEATVTIPLETKIIDGTVPADKIYQTGDVMYDFSIETIDDRIFTLSEVLEEKKMVLINFWYSTCGPCVTEFPWINVAYQQYEDSVAILAVDPIDSEAVVSSFVSQHELAFDVAANSSFSSNYPVAAYPTSIIVDRYGVVALAETGRFEDTNEILSLFAKYTSDDYVQQIKPSTPGGGSDGGEEEEELIKPNVPAPDLADVKTALAGENYSFDFAFDDGEYSWPWIIEEIDGRTALKASNTGVNSSYSILTTTFTVTEEEVVNGAVLAFDYKLQTELNYDIFYIIVNDTVIQSLSGPEKKYNDKGEEIVEESEWKTCFAFVPQHAGEYMLVLTYAKDAGNATGFDGVYIDNMRFDNVSSITEPTALFRHAATQETNAEADENTPRYSSYVSYVMGDDGYYHVGDKNGPYLLAAINERSLWSEYSLYSLINAGYLKIEIEGETIDLTPMFDGTGYAWRANHCDYLGYHPVDETLAYILDMIAKCNGYGYENEWLEFCAYYERFADDSPLVDPILGIDYLHPIYLDTIDVDGGETELTWTVSLSKPIVPRGYKYAFTPTKTGVYEIRSTVASDNLLIDPIGWVFVKNENGIDYDMLAENDQPINGDNNFVITIKLQAGTTYYIAIGEFDVAFVGSFGAKITYLGEQVNVLANCGTYHTFTEGTDSTYYVGDAINYDLGDDGYYHERKSNGELGSRIYLDMLNPTYLFPTASLKSIIETPQYSTDGLTPNLTGDGYLVTGFDLSSLYYFTEGGVALPVLKADGSKYGNHQAKMEEYLAAALANEGELYGYVAVDETLMEILLEFCECEDGWGGAINSWQMMCYYYRDLDLQ